MRRDWETGVVYPNGDEYNGWWKDDKSNGAGKVVWKDGRVFTDQYVNGMREGTGKLVYPNGDDGQFLRLIEYFI